MSIVFFSNIAQASWPLWQCSFSGNDGAHGERLWPYSALCVLASSRVAGLQYWKTWRLFFAALVVLESLRKMKEMTFQQRRNTLGFVVVILLCTGIPALLSEHKLAGLEETILLSSMWLAMLVLGGTHSEKLRFSFFNDDSFGLVIIGACLISKYASYDLSHLNGRFREFLAIPMSSAIGGWGFLCLAWWLQAIGERNAHWRWSP